MHLDMRLLALLPAFAGAASTPSPDGDIKLLPGPTVSMAFAYAGISAILMVLFDYG